MPASINPLTAHDIALAQQIRNDVPVLVDFFQRCQECGRDAQQQIALAKSLDDYAANVLRHFGHGNTNL